MNLGPQAAVFVDFEHINRHMRRNETLDPFERAVPASSVCPEASDQVDIEVTDARRTQNADSRSTISAVCLRPVRASRVC